MTVAGVLINKGGSNAYLAQKDGLCYCEASIVK